MPNKRYNGTKHAIPKVKRKRPRALKAHELTKKGKNRGR